VAGRTIGQVTGAALKDTAVLVLGIGPVFCRVAGRAFPLIVSGRRIILQVAALAVFKASVVERDVVPVGGAWMAVQAGIGIALHSQQIGLPLGWQPAHVPQPVLCLCIVVRWALVKVAGTAFKSPLVVKGRDRPTIHYVTVLAVAGKVVGVQRIGRQLVAAHAIGRGIGVLPVPVAIHTFDLLVLADERIDLVVDILPQEGDRLCLEEQALLWHARHNLFRRVGFLQGPDLALERVY
jgi:hypothetical protein